MLHTRITILFWNVRLTNVTQNLVRLVQGHNANILLVAEANALRDAEGLLRALNQAPRQFGESEFTLIESPVAFKPKANTAMSRFQVYTSLSQQAWEPVVMTNRYALWKIHIDQQYLRQKCGEYRGVKK